MSLTVIEAEWLERHIGKRGVAGLSPGGVIYFHFEFLACSPLGESHSNHSSMTFIKSNGYKEIYLIHENMAVYILVKTSNRTLYIHEYNGI